MDAKRWLFVRCSVCLLVLVLSGMLLTPQPTHAATRTVTNGDDSGSGSLRQALVAAEAGDTIIFATNVTTVTLTSDQLTIRDDLTIDGGPTGVVIRRDDNASDFRIFMFSGSETDVTLDSLTIANGNSNDGGGIYNDSGTLTVLNSTLSSNISSFFSSDGSFSGGGIYNAGGTVVVVSSTFSGNAVINNGGGIYNAGGTVAVVSSTFSSNSATKGGAIYNDGGGRVTVTGSVISGNEALGGAAGGGIANYDGRVVVNTSTISGNTADGACGGIANVNFNHDDDNLPQFEVTDSTISNNAANRYLGSGGDGGGICNAGGRVVVTDSTLSGNTAEGTGGGINNDKNNVNDDSVAQVAVTNSTLSGNTAEGTGGGINNDNNNVNDDSVAQVAVTNSTLSGNTAEDAGGGGIYNDNNGTVTLVNSIIASSDGGDYVGSALTLQGGNIVADGSIAGAIIADPNLGPLQDNGGLTLTHMPQDGSPAIDAGDSAVVLLGLISDQRGFMPRVVGGSVDIGAVEVGAVEPAMYFLPWVQR